VRGTRPTPYGRASALDASERGSEESERDDPGTRVLDVGCGPGWETATFEARDIATVGLHLTRDFLTDASERAPESAFLRADMRSLPLAGDQFEGI